MAAIYGLPVAASRQRVFASFEFFRYVGIKHHRSSRFQPRMLDDLLFVFTLLYAAQIGIFAIGAHRARYKTDTAYRPSVSIIIAARDEASNIVPCLESLTRLTYPKDALDIIVVNDHSTDATADIIKGFALRHPFIRLHNATTDPAGRLHGKPNAVAQGVDTARGEILMFTDADCVVPTGWVEETVKYYTHGEVGIVAGFTSLKWKNVFEAVQALDWFMLFSVAAATTRLKYPVTAVGNNLSVRRSAYDAVGGFRGIPFSITEDYALFHAITTQGGYTARFPIDAGTLVESLPCPDAASLYRQKKRWFIGGTDMNFKSIALFSVGYIFKMLLLVNLVVNGLTPILLPLAVKMLADFLLVRPALKQFKKMPLLIYLVLFEVYYITYVVLFPPVVLLSRRVRWKGRDFGK